MSTLLLDTSLLVAAYNDREAFHDKAMAVVASVKAGRWASVLLHE